MGSLYVGGGPANGTVQTCFDNYGDTGAAYCLKNGTQNVAVRRMVECLTGVGPCHGAMHARQHAPRGSP